MKRDGSAIPSQPREMHYSIGLTVAVCSRASAIMGESGMQIQEPG